VEVILVDIHSGLASRTIILRMKNITSILNDLIETLKDGQEGFRAASTNVNSTKLKTLFSEYSLQRSKFAGELKTLAHSLSYKEPDTTGSVAGSLHRGWINLKAALSSKDEHAILAECERGEDSAVAEYQKALKTQGLPAPVREAIRTQSSAVKAAHDRIRDLRDSLAVK
jgi:uncharacterized protein (TIGR02284 family)